jgi:hypothetical protein
LDWEATLLPLAPGDLASRIRRLLVASPHLAVRQMCALADETFDLVESELPTFDIAKVRVAFGVRRTGS